MRTESVEAVAAAVDVLVDDVAVLDVEAVDWLELREQLLTLERVRERLECAIGEVVAGCDAAAVSVRDGSKCMADWLHARTGQHRSVTGSRCWLATRLVSMPRTRVAHRDGAITGSHVRVLTRAQNPRTEEAFARDEHLLVGAATKLTAEQLARVVEHWLRHVDPDGAEPDGLGDGEDVFRLSETLDGALKGDFVLHGENAIRAKAIIDEITEQVRRRDEAAGEVDPTDPRATQATARRRARALMEVLDRASSSPQNPARRQPLFVVQTTLETVTRTGDPFEWKTELDLAWKSAIPGSVLDRMYCDASFARLVLDAEGHILDHGRSKRLADRAQRRALLGRYGGCATPGCHAPPGWCEIHHIPEWNDGGRTDRDAMIPQCSWCHHRIHDGTLTVAMIDGNPTYRTADGRTLTDPRAGPP